MIVFETFALLCFAMGSVEVRVALLRFSCEVLQYLIPRCALLGFSIRVLRPCLRAVQLGLAAMLANILHFNFGSAVLLAKSLHFYVGTAALLANNLFLFLRPAALLAKRLRWVPRACLRKLCIVT